MLYSSSAHTGLILKLPVWNQPPDEYCFDDSVSWKVMHRIQNENVNDSSVAIRVAKDPFVLPESK